MSLSRRTLIATGVVALMAGCAPSPVIEGGPADPWTPAPTEPEQSESARRATVVVAALADEIGALGQAAPTWDPPADVGQWTSAVRRALDVHLDRLRSVDLFDEPDPVFPRPAATDPEIPAGQAEAETWFRTRVAEYVQELRGLAREAAEQSERLVYTSLALFAHGTPHRGQLPVPGPTAPFRMAETSVEPSAVVALSHAWALLRGLEIGLARLADDDPLMELGTRRINSARDLRNELRDLAQAEQEFTYEMPNAMTDADQIRVAWAALEANLLDALARLFVASNDEHWFDLLIAQVTHVQAMGRPLPYWPGWVAA